jgi:peptide/nickel transport system substrate-binding protein
MQSMSSHPRFGFATLSRFLPAIGLFLALASIGTWSVIDVAAQNKSKKPPVEEEEDQNSGKPKKKVIKEEEDPNGGKPKKKINIEDEDPNPPQSKVPVRVDEPRKNVDVPTAADLAAAWRQTKHPVLRALYRELSKPHDVITFDRINPNQRLHVEYVEPLKNYYASDADFRESMAIKPLNHEDWSPLAKSEIFRGSHVKIKPYELRAVEKVQEMRGGKFDTLPESEKNYLSTSQILQAAETVLTAVLRFHDAARESNVRDGDGWDGVANTVRAKLLEVHLEQLARVAAGKDWEATLAEARRVADSHRRMDEREQIARPLIELAQQTVAGENPSDAALREGRRRFLQIEELVPGSAVAGPVGAKLRQKALNLFEQAKAHQAKNEDKQALELLDQAEAIWAQLPGLHDMRLRLNNAYPVLRVGVQQLPSEFIPGLATSDADKQAIELLYESLVRPTFANPFNQGYDAVLAIGLPKLAPLGREFKLANKTFWSDEKPLTAKDVTKTVELLQNKDWPGYSPAWTDLIEEAHQVGGDPSSVRITLKRGLVDPLSLMSFKVLPRDLTPANYAKFNEKPVSSGPYKFGSIINDKDGRKTVVFIANPTYSVRAGKTNLPRIREIHFVRCDDPVKDFGKGDDKRAIDLFANPTADQIKALRANSSVVVTEPKPNRRIYFLAINHLKPALKNENLRRALAQAINREKILDECFRGEFGKNAHHALSGPFPAGSWAGDPSLDTLDRLDKAKTFADLAAKDGFRDVKLTLRYPQNDSQAEKAMTVLRDQVKEVGIILDLQKMDAVAMRNAVEQVRDYDLAYYHYDFASEVYSLKPLFEQGNYFNYPPDAQLQAKFGDMLGHRDFSEIQRPARHIHGIFQTQMPFVPLWQLDTVVVYSSNLKPGPIDPLLLFPGVEEWRLEKKGL